MLKLTAGDLKAIQEATTTWAKRARLGRQVTQKCRTIKLNEYRALCSKKKEKAQKKKEREEKQAK